jgi:hypothetical protein
VDTAWWRDEGGTVAAGEMGINADTEVAVLADHRARHTTGRSGALGSASAAEVRETACDELATAALIAISLDETTALWPQGREHCPHRL